MALAAEVAATCGGETAHSATGTDAFRKDVAQDDRSDHPESGVRPAWSVTVMLWYSPRVVHMVDRASKAELPLKSSGNSCGRLRLPYWRGRAGRCFATPIQTEWYSEGTNMPHAATSESAWPNTSEGHFLVALQNDKFVKLDPDCPQQNLCAF